MQGRNSLFIGLGALVGLALLLMVFALLLLPACAVLVPLGVGSLGQCPGEGKADTEAKLKELDSERQRLEAEVGGLSRDLALRQCAVAPPPTPPRSETPSGIDREAWNERDLGAMEGCWALDSEYVIRDRNTGAPSPQQEWRVCFDAEGRGTQIMKSEDGVRCDGTMTGTFDAQGRLVMREPGNLQCSGGVFIYERETTCTLNEQGEAVCESRQPETGGAGTVRLKKDGAN